MANHSFQYYPNPTVTAVVGSWNIESYDDDDAWIFTKVLMTFIYSILTIIGIVGNLLVILVVLKFRGMKTTTNCYLVSLAASDTLFFLATTPVEVVYLFTKDYKFGSIGCSILTYLPYLAINSSSLSITAFTVERFIGICYPYRARTMCTVKRAKLIIFIIWVFSLIYHLPWMFLASVIVDSQGRFCDFKLERDQWQYKVLYLGDFSAFYVIPMFLNVVIYAKIAITLSQCGDKLKQSVKPRGTKEQVHNTLIVEARECHVTGRRSSAKGRNQVVKMLALVVLIFAICWLPYRAMVVYNSFAKIQWRPEWYVNLSKTLIYINCAINPILYNLMSAGFRRAFLSLFNAKPLTTYQSRLNNTGTLSTYHSRATISERKLTNSRTEEGRSLVSSGCSPV